MLCLYTIIIQYIIYCQNIITPTSPIFQVIYNVYILTMAVYNFSPEMTTYNILIATDRYNRDSSYRMEKEGR
jgi:hypothetical protein